MTATRLLTRSDVARLLTLDECIAAVEDAFRLHAEGRTLPPGVLGVHASDGSFHVKAAGLLRERPYCAIKANANFPANPARHGLPTIQGVIALFDATNGALLALVDSMEITTLRTGAATAVAARPLARADARVATICGCGIQGAVQLRAVAKVRRLERVHAFDVDAARADRFARELSAELGLDVRPTSDLAAAVRDSAICVTCTPSRAAFLMRADVAPGTFVAGVGADNPHKQELDPQLLAAATIVVDVLDQCATIGDLHHALAAGAVTLDRVHAELADVVAGRKPGRRTADEITVFDSTGTALQDVAAAGLVYERAVAEGRGRTIDLGE